MIPNILGNLAHEFVIIVHYAVFPTVLSLLLSFIDWHYGVLLSIIKLFIFLRLIHNEDKTTGSMPFKYIFIKLLIAVGFYYFTEWATNELEERYLPAGIYPKSSSNTPDGGASTVQITVPKSKARKILKAQQVDDWWSKVTYVLVKILVHYLYMVNSVAQYRWSFLATILIIYGIIYIIVAIYLPGPKRPKPSDANAGNVDYYDSSDSEEDDDQTSEY